MKARSTDARVGVEVSTAVLTHLGGGLEQESLSAITHLVVLAEGAAELDEGVSVAEEELNVGVEAAQTLDFFPLG